MQHGAQNKHKSAGYLYQNLSLLICKLLINNAFIGLARYAVASFIYQVLSGAGTLGHKKAQTSMNEVWAIGYLTTVSDKRHETQCAHQ